MSSPPSVSSKQIFTWGRSGAPLGLNDSLKDYPDPVDISANFEDDKIVQMSAGSQHCVALTATGTLYSWGQNHSGQLAHGDTVDRLVPEVVRTVTLWNVTLKRKVVKACVGELHTVLATSDGMLFAVGDNNDTILGIGPRSDIVVHPRSILIPNASSRPLISPSASPPPSTSLQSSSSSSSLTNGTSNLSSSVSSLNDASADSSPNVGIDTLGRHSMAIGTDGRVLSWGMSTHGQLGHGMCEPSFIPRPIISLENIKVVQVECGWSHSLCLSEDGRVFAFGEGSDGKLGLGNNLDFVVPFPINTFINNKITIKSIAAGHFHSAAVDDKGFLYTWGSGACGVLGHGNTQSQLTPKKVVLWRKSKLKSLKGSGGADDPDLSLSISKTPRTPEKKTKKSNEDSTESNDLVLTPPATPSRKTKMNAYSPSITSAHIMHDFTTEYDDSEDAVYAIAAGAFHMLAANRDGKVFSWGKGDTFALGHGSTHDLYYPTQITSLRNVHISMVACGMNHSMAAADLPEEGLTYESSLTDPNGSSSANNSSNPPIPGQKIHSKRTASTNQLDKDSAEALSVAAFLQSSAAHQTSSATSASSPASITNTTSSATPKSLLVATKPHVALSGPPNPVHSTIPHSLEPPRSITLNLGSSKVPHTTGGKGSQKIDTANSTATTSGPTATPTDSSQLASTTPLPNFTISMSTGTPDTTMQGAPQIAPTLNESPPSSSSSGFLGAAPVPLSSSARNVADIRDRGCTTTASAFERAIYGVEPSRRSATGSRNRTPSTGEKSTKSKTTELDTTGVAESEHIVGYSTAFLSLGGSNGSPHTSNSDPDVGSEKIEAAPISKPMRISPTQRRYSVHSSQHHHNPYAHLNHVIPPKGPQYTQDWDDYPDSVGTWVATMIDTAEYSRASMFIGAEVATLRKMLDIASNSSGGDNESKASLEKRNRRFRGSSFHYPSNPSAASENDALSGSDASKGEDSARRSAEEEEEADDEEDDDEDSDDEDDGSGDEEERDVDQQSETSDAQAHRSESQRDNYDSKLESRGLSLAADSSSDPTSPHLQKSVKSTKLPLSMRAPLSGSRKIRKGPSGLSSTPPSERSHFSSSLDSPSSSHPMFTSFIESTNASPSNHGSYPDSPSKHDPPVLEPDSPPKIAPATINAAERPFLTMPTHFPARNGLNSQIKLGFTHRVVDSVFIGPSDPMYAKIQSTDASDLLPMAKTPEQIASEFALVPRTIGDIYSPSSSSSSRRDRKIKSKKKKQSKESRRRSNGRIAKLFEEMFRSKDTDRGDRLDQSQYEIDKQAAEEETTSEYWLTVVMPNWESMKKSNSVKRLWRGGFPANIRGVMWNFLIKNDLSVDYNIYDAASKSAKMRYQLWLEGAHDPRKSGQSVFHVIDVDVPRTHPETKLFKPGGPFHGDLVNLLHVYSAFDRDMSYVQGMSYLAAFFIIHMDAFSAFRCFANLVNTHFYRNLFKMNLNQMLRHMGAYDLLFERCMPALFLHFKALAISPEQYLLDWFMTCFGRAFSLQTSSRIFDCLIIEGEVFLYRTALAILKLSEKQLLKADFETLLPMFRVLSRELDEDTLFSTINSIKVPREVRDYIKRIVTESPNAGRT